MANNTKKVILCAFEELLEEKPFDKITVGSLVKRAGISPNTFYYHFSDIYAMLETWFRECVTHFLSESELREWKTATKTMLRQCQAHPKKIYHVFNCLSRDRLERYIFSLADDVFFRLVQTTAEGRSIPEARLREIAAFFRYAYVGFVLHFFWNGMVDNIDESVDRLGVLFDDFLEVSCRGNGAE